MTSSARQAQRAGPLTRGLLWLALANSLAVPIALAALPSHAGSRGMLGETYGLLLRLRQEDDSWGPMRQAFEYAQREERPKNLYEKIFFTRHVKFQYPPTALLPFWALSKTLPRDAWAQALNVASLAFLVASIAASAWLLNASLAERGEGGPLCWLLGIWLALAFYPLVKSYSLGQIQTWVNGLYALALACWATRRERLAGALTGLMCLIKPHYAVFALWGALRGRRGFVASLLAVGAAGLAASLSLFGLANHLEYLDVVAFLSRRGEGYFPNQSLNGLLNRALRNGNNLHWMGASFAPYHPLVFWCTTVAGLILLLAALQARGVRHGGVVDFGLMALSVTLASPIAWEHHYGILPPIYAATLGLFAAAPVLGRSTPGWLALSYGLTSNYIGATNLLADTRWNVLQSHLFFGALLLLLALHALRARAADGPE